MSGSGHMLVNYETLSNAEQAINQTANTLNSKLEELHSYLAPIVNDWSGSAAEAYQAQQKQWDSAQTDMNNVLQTIGKAVAAACEAYQQTESANQAMWG